MNSFIISNVRMVTLYSVLENAFVYVKKGIIEAIGQTSPGRVHRSCNIINGRGNWLFPGIVDLYNKTFDSGTSFFDAENSLASHGVTTVCHLIPEDDTTLFNDFNKYRRLGLIRHHSCSNPCTSGTLTLISAAGILQETAKPSNIEMTDIVENNDIYILCSDNAEATVLEAIFTLHGTLGLSMVDAVAMATITPAMAFGVEKKLGSIECGKNADLVMVSPTGPRAEMVFVSGCKVYENCDLSGSNNNAV